MELEIELNDTTVISGYVNRFEDSEGDPNVIYGTRPVYDYSVDDLRVEFMEINVAHLLTEEQKEKYREQLIQKRLQIF